MIPTVIRSVVREKHRVTSVSIGGWPQREIDAVHCTVQTQTQTQTQTLISMRSGRVVKDLMTADLTSPQQMMKRRVSLLMRLLCVSRINARTFNGRD